VPIQEEGKARDQITTNLRLPRALHAAVRSRAEREQRTLNGQIVWMLSQYIEQADRPPANPHGERTEDR
jgi:hypothetical protein